MRLCTYFLSLLFLKNLFSLSLDEDFANQIRDCKERYFIPGVAICLIDGAECQNYCMGYANLESKMPVLPETLFFIGSISKSLSSIGILYWLKKSDISLETSVCETLKTTFFLDKDVREQLSYRRLLNHTSGLKYTISQGTPWQSPVANKLDLSKIKSIMSPRINPQKEFVYTASGYLLLQYVMQQMIAKPIESFFKKEIFQKLGMQCTSFSGEFRGKTATGYNLYRRPQNSENHLAKFAAGFLSDIRDLACFVQGFWNGQIKSLVGEETFKEILRPNKNAYSLGFGVERIGNKLLVSHEGTNRGWNAYFGCFPELKKGIVILTNSDLGLLFIRDLSSIWIQKVLGSRYRSLCKELDLWINIGLIAAFILFLCSIFIKGRKISAPTKLRQILYKGIPGIFMGVWGVFFYSPFSLFPGWIIASYLPLTFHLITLFVVLAVAMFCLKGRVFKKR